MLNKNVLIVDDDIEFNNNLCSKFEENGFTVYQSYDIHAFLEYQDKNIALTVLNIDMNDADIEKISIMGSKVVLLSNSDSLSLRDKFFYGGILDFYVKSEQLEYIVEDIINSLDNLEKNIDDTILIVDTSNKLLESLESILTNRNYNLLTADNIKDALDIISLKPISLLIVDMELCNGEENNILAKLKNKGIIDQFPILSSSSLYNPSIIAQTLKKGSSDFIKKPFVYEELLLKIDLLIKAYRSKQTISKQKKELEQSFDRYKNLVDATLDALLIFEDHICVEANIEAVNMLGLNSKEEIISKGIFDIFTDVSDKHKVELEDNSIDHLFEDKLVNKNGDILDVQIKEKNIKQDDKIIKIIAILDITQIKQNEKMLHHQTKMASMGEMIGNIAHQWRQPLTAISVAAGGIKLNFELDMVDEEETLFELENIVSNTQFLSNTIEDFQNFLKDNRTKVHYSFDETLNKTKAIISANLDSHEISVIKLYTNKIQLYGIQNDLIQVLLNIINNAADILKTEDFKGKKKYILIDARKDDQNITIQVQDSAGGVPDHIIGKIFEPYFTTKHQAQGTGLGLYMTHQLIVDSMNGDIQVQNLDFEYEGEKYRGANFKITIPLDNQA